MKFPSILVEATLHKIDTTLKNHIDYIFSGEMQEKSQAKFKCLHHIP